MPPRRSRLAPPRRRTAAQPLGEILQSQLFPELGRLPSIGFVTRLVVATTLPHSEPANNEFVRHSGIYDLCLLAPSRVGLPFGRYPRLALAWMITEAVRRKTPFLSLGPNLTSFAWAIGVTPSTGPRGTLLMLREQLNRLVHVNVSCDGNPEQAARFGFPPAFTGGGVRLVKRHLLWWNDPPPPDHEPSFVELSQDFFEEILAHPIPIRLDVVRGFRSPMEMDVYVWLTYRSIRATRINRPEPVSWLALKNQFGADYAEVRVFRYHFLQALKNVMRVYPEVRVRSSSRELLLLPYPPHVPRP
jgi:hypothetical protein